VEGLSSEGAKVPAKKTSRKRSTAKMARKKQPDVAAPARGDIPRCLGFECPGYERPDHHVGS
jgi:hypothetical protein